MLWDTGMTVQEMKKRQEEYKKQAIEMAKRSQVKPASPTKDLKSLDINQPQKSQSSNNTDIPLKMESSVSEQSKSVQTDSAQKKTEFPTKTSPIQTQQPSTKPSEQQSIPHQQEQSKRADWIRSNTIQFHVSQLNQSNPSNQSQPTQFSQQINPVQDKSDNQPIEQIKFRLDKIKQPIKIPKSQLDKLLKPCPTKQNSVTQRIRSTAAISRRR